jgi:hypothetical protein
MGGVLAAEAKEANAFTREGVSVSPWEAIAYDALAAAADADRPCPLNLDIEMLVGCRSGSVVPGLVARLERKGLIKVVRYQRFRRVMIVATKKWTRQQPGQHRFEPHVPRGGASQAAFPTERKRYRHRVDRKSASTRL